MKKKIIFILMSGTLLLSSCGVSDIGSFNFEGLTSELPETTSVSIQTSENMTETVTTQKLMTDEELVLSVRENMDNYTYEEAASIQIGKDLINMTCYAVLLKSALEYVADNSQQYFSHNDKIKISFFEFFYSNPYELVISYYDSNNLPCYDIVACTFRSVHLAATIKGVDYNERVAFIPDWYLEENHGQSYPPSCYYIQTKYSENSDSFVDWYNIDSLALYPGIGYRTTTKPNGELICEYYRQRIQYYFSEEEMIEWTGQLEEVEKTNGYHYAPYTSKELTQEDILSDELINDLILFV